MRSKGARKRATSAPVAPGGCQLSRSPAQLLLAFFLIVPVTASRGDTLLSAYYTGEIVANTDGGLRTGSAYLSDAGVTIDADLNGFVGNTDARFFTYILWNNSNTFSERYVGDAQVVSNIDAEQAVRIYEFWYQQSLNEDITLRFGLYDLNSEFDAIDTASLFSNSSHGIGAEYAQSGLAGPSIFPVTSLAARFGLAVTERSRLRYAILDGVPGDPNDQSKTRIDLGGSDGVLHALEYNFTTNNGARFGVGGWLYSAEFDRIEPTIEQPRDDGNRGAYGFIDAPMYSNESGTRINGFLRYGVANDELNVFDSYFGAGVVATGLIPSRPDDLFGLAIASVRTGDSYDRVVGGADSHETTIELTYSVQVTDWLRIQPDLQMVVNPGVDPSLKNALVIGLRFRLASGYAFTHDWR